jgi:hypothetical protein
LRDRIDLGCRQLYIFIIRYYRFIPKRPTKDDILDKVILLIDDGVLYRFANLVNKLGFESPEITTLRQLRELGKDDIEDNYNPFLVIIGPGEAYKYRCGREKRNSYKDVWKYLFISNLYNLRKEQGEGIISFFILRSRYLIFFGKLESPGIALAIRNSNERSLLYTSGSKQPTRYTENAKTKEDTNIREGIEEIIALYNYKG